jgi:hypothetical protein
MYELRIVFIQTRGAAPPFCHENSTKQTNTAGDCPADLPYSCAYPARQSTIAPPGAGTPQAAAAQPPKAKRSSTVQTSEIAGVGQRRTKPRDLLVLGGQPRHRRGTKPPKLSDLGVLPGHAILQPADLVCESLDLSFTRIGDLTCFAKLVAASFEFLFEVQVGGVEGGSGDARFACQRRDVSLTAWWQITPQETVHHGLDTVFDAPSLLVSDPHPVEPPVPRACPAAASISATTRMLRSYSPCSR